MMQWTLGRWKSVRSLRLENELRRTIAADSANDAYDDDPARTLTVADLCFIAQFEVDLVDEGESHIDVRKHRRFVSRWS